MKYLNFFVFLCILTFTVSCGQQKKYVQYKVKEGETIRIIAKRLDMKTKDLLRLNPDVKRKPKANTVIIIPNKGVKIAKENTIKDVVVKEKDLKKQQIDTVSVSENVQDEKELTSVLENEYEIHEIVKGNTFYSLTRFYNVTKDQLIELNPELSEGLKLGQIIKIRPVLAVFEDDEFLYKDEIEQGVAIKAAIMLPFREQELDSLSKNEIFNNNRLANIVTDFYLGAEIAIDSLRNQGVELNIDVFDTGKKSTKINTIIAENNFDDTDVIIGPLYSEEVQFIATNIKSPIIFPVHSKKQSKFTSRRIVKTAANKQLFRDKLLEYVKENFNDGNVIIVGDGKYKSNLTSERIQNELQSHDSIKNVSIVISEKGYIKKELFIDVLKPNMKNTVVMTTDDNVIVASAINSLISLPEEVTATVYTFDKVSALNKIDNAKLAKLGFTYVTDEYIKEDSFKTITFNRKYLAKNGALPSFYATRGFDVTYDVLMRLASGKSLKSTFSKGYSYRIEGKFDYTDETFKPTENTGLFIVKYNTDLTLTRIK